MLDEILRRAEQGGFLAHRDLVRLLTVDDREFESVREAAYRVKLREIGPLVSLRGLIEIGNVCRKNCFYCGIRSGNREVRRYELTEDQIVAAARIAVDYDYGSLVLQGGERSDAPFVELIAPGLKNNFPSAFTSMYAGLTIVESVHVINNGTVAETVDEIS